MAGRSGGRRLTPGGAAIVCTLTSRTNGLLWWQMIRFKYIILLAMFTIILKLLLLQYIPP